MIVVAERQEVTVSDTAHVDVDPSANVGALVLKGTDLDSLSDDPDDLQNDLEALAGPAAGPNGGQIYIDGFTGGQLPPQESIPEIRINQNPFSAEYDKLGFGRIEVFTKPGTDKFRGQVFFNFGDSIFNSRNPFAPDKPPYQQRMLSGNLSGPLGKKASFFIDAERRDQQETSVISALLLTGPFSQAVLADRKSKRLNPTHAHSLSERTPGQEGFVLHRRGTARQAGNVGNQRATPYRTVQPGGAGRSEEQTSEPDPRAFAV